MLKSTATSTVQLPFIAGKVRHAQRAAAGRQESNATSSHRYDSSLRHILHLSVLVHERCEHIGDVGQTPSDKLVSLSNQKVVV